MSDEQLNLWALNAAIIGSVVLLAGVGVWLFLLTKNGWVLGGFFVTEIAAIGFGRFWVMPRLVRSSSERLR